MYQEGGTTSHHPAQDGGEKQVQNCILGKVKDQDEVNGIIQ